MDFPQGYIQKFRIDKKVQFEFQALCQELEPIYGKGIWTLPYKPGFTESKIRDAHKVCEQRGVRTLGYLIGVIKKLNY